MRNRKLRLPIKSNPVNMKISIALVAQNRQISIKETDILGTAMNTMAKLILHGPDKIESHSDLAYT